MNSNEQPQVKAALPTRPLGATGMHPTALAMGGAWLGNRSDTEREAVEAVHRAFERGINFFDTDPMYVRGKGEPRLGKALRELPREAYYLSTKVGTRPGMHGDLTAAGVRASFEQSLEALGVDQVDLLMIHDPPDIEAALAPGAALDEMRRLQAEGLTRHLGLGTRWHSSHRLAMDTGAIDVVLTFLDYTLLDQSVLETTLPEATRRGVGLILGSPLAMGVLAGGEPDRKREPVAHAMWQWAEARGLSLAHLALQFCLSVPIDGCVMTGPATAEEVDQAIDLALEPIEESVWAEFEQAFGLRRCTERAQLLAGREARET